MPSGGAGGALVKTGPGTVELTATNPYSGGTTVTAGTLRVGNATRPLGSGNAAVSGGTLAVGIAASLAGVTVDAGGQVVLDSMASRVLDVPTLAVDESPAGWWTWEQAGSRSPPGWMQRRPPGCGAWATRWSRPARRSWDLRRFVMRTWTGWSTRWIWC
ncbi:MAG: hypothetical protein FJ284_01010 [Planctomycetes bacterium]|nr:hypothetical protein [Planctomycetota bacterium]